jgi:7-cyano-7-deazaguanine synthase in queuosine biosynthesis
MTARTILLYGGGIDSTALLLHLRRTMRDEVVALFVDYGQGASEAERAACATWCERTDTVMVSRRVRVQDEGGMFDPARTDFKVEGRNLLLLREAAIVAIERNATRIALGFHVEPSERPYPDATIDALNTYNDCLRHVFGRGDVEVVAPFRLMSRLDIASLGHALDHRLLQDAHTCYRATPCGTCPHCKQREAMLSHVRDQR